MTSKIKNIILFLVIAAVLIFLYVVFIKKDPEEAALTSLSSNPSLPSETTEGQNSLIAQDFLNLLLNVKSINLDDSIFSDPAFTSLFDSSIELTPEGTEGRPNPFAPIGS